MEEQLTYSIPDVSLKTGLGKTTIYKAISLGRLRAKKLGNRTLILAGELDKFLNSLPEIDVVKHLPLKATEEGNDQF